MDHTARLHAAAIDTCLCAVCQLVISPDTTQSFNSIKGKIHHHHHLYIHRVITKTKEEPAARSEAAEGMMLLDFTSC